MENTALIALTRQSTLRRKMDVVAHNMANMNTTGFKAGKMMFVDHIERLRGGDKLSREKISFVRDVATAFDMSEGPMKQTNNPLDLAITGKGYFAVRTETGEENYTRNGRFQLDDTGQLVNQNGLPVLSDNGQPFFFTPQDGEITIARDGSVSTKNGQLGRLKVVQFENEQKLEIGAGGLYTSKELPTPVDRPHVIQGMLEGSNVNGITTMTDMMKVHRSYNSARSLIEKEDERIKKMIETYGRAV